MNTAQGTDIRALLDMDFAWTPRQREVLDRITHGKSNQQIADDLGISLDGAKWHMREILSKLNVETREDAAEYWRLYNGWQPRLARAFRGIAHAAPLKWAAAGGAVVVLGVVAIAVYAALRGDEERQAGEPIEGTPTATVSPAATVTPAPTPTPVSTPVGHPTGTRTGVPEVDAVLDAVTSGEADRVDGLLEWYAVRCEANPIGLGSPTPKCPDGTAEGTPVEIFPNGSCPSFRGATRDNVDVLLSNFVRREARPVAVYRQTSSGPAGLEFPAGEFGILLAVPSQSGFGPGYGVARIQVTDGRIVVAGVACPNDTIEQELARAGSTDYLLPPP